MIEDVKIVSVPVADQERAKTFYVDRLGFEVRADDTWGEGMRWIEVAPAGADVSLTLVTWFEAMPPGSLQGLVVRVRDVDATYEELTERGVTFDLAPIELPGGRQAVLRDPDGNSFVLSGS